MLGGLDPMPPYRERSTLCQAISTACPERLTSWPPETTPSAEQSLLANRRRDLSAADSDTESPRSGAVDAGIKATLAPS